MFQLDTLQTIMSIQNHCTILSGETDKQEEKTEKSDSKEETESKDVKEKKEDKTEEEDKTEDKEGEYQEIQVQDFREQRHHQNCFG